ncbi:unnamed protein product [Durusdinium trenchii]|uniref:Uncharacterized protein n=1 Tax=Durusdinium trenchii TaxID=1381693 RepID=A0ABP0PY38_9DINO
MAQRSGPVAPATGPVDAPDALPRMLPTGFDELLQAIHAVHDSIANRLDTLEDGLHHLGEQMDHRFSVSSAASESRRAKRQAKQSAAKQALQMDISSLVPFRAPHRRRTASEDVKDTKDMKDKDVENKTLKEKKEEKKAPRKELKPMAEGREELEATGHKVSGTASRGSHSPPKLSRRTSSVEMQQVVSGRANLSDVFKLRETRLTANLSPRRLTAVLPIPSGQSESDQPSLLEESLVLSWSQSCWLTLSPLNNLVSRHFSAALGLVPLFGVSSLGCTRWWASRLYHWLLISFLFFRLVSKGYDLVLCHNADQAHNLCFHPWPPLAVDFFLILGSCLVLLSLGGFWSYKDTTRLVAQSIEELSCYCEKTSLDMAWKIWSSSDALLLVLVWLALLGDASCLEAKRDWRGISSLFRKTSRSFERCLTALGSTMVMLIFAQLYDLQQDRGMDLVASSMFVAYLIPGVLWTHASTTTACRRLPSLVTLCDVEDEEQDHDYLGLATFLSLSECGFFVWDTCVTMGLVQKLLYFTFALAGTVGFQTGAVQKILFASAESA